MKGQFRAWPSPKIGELKTGILIRFPVGRNLWYTLWCNLWWILVGVLSLRNSIWSRRLRSLRDTVRASRIVRLFLRILFWIFGISHSFLLSRVHQ